MSVLDHPDGPYKEGRTLEVTLKESFSPSSKDAKMSTLHVHIHKRFDPVSLSPVMFVTVEETGESLVAKFYDRRFSPHWREFESCEQWNELREEGYRDFVRDGEAKKFLAVLSRGYDETRDGWLPEHRQVLAWKETRDLFLAETGAYHALEWMQGQNVPRMLDTLSLSTFVPDRKEQQRFFEVNGVLLEYIDGFPLAFFTNHAPREVWNEVFDETISLVHSVGELGVHSIDTTAFHVFVRRSDGGRTMASTYTSVLFDFGSTWLRKEYSTEAQWLKAKRDQREDEAIGLAMQKILQKLGGDYVFRPSFKW